MRIKLLLVSLILTIGSFNQSISAQSNLGKRYRAIHTGDDLKNVEDKIVLILNKDSSYTLTCFHDTSNGQYEIIDNKLYTESAVWHGQKVVHWKIRDRDKLLLASLEAKAESGQSGFLVSRKLFRRKFF